MSKDITDFKAVMTMQQVKNGEEKYQNKQKAIGITRRCLFAFLTKNKKELVEAVKDEELALAAMDLIEAANVNIDYLEGVLSLMSSSRDRLLFVMGEVYDRDNALS